MSKISKRELLSFCQLANLDWQFVNIKILEKDNAFQLSKALNPNYFLRTTKDIYGKIIKIEGGEKLENVAIYGRNEEGRVTLRKKLGMTMELLEKKESGSKEGSYLDEWEVLGGYDNYALEREIMEEEWKKNKTEIDVEKKGLSKELEEVLKSQKIVVEEDEITYHYEDVFSPEAKEMIRGGQCPEKLLEENINYIYKGIEELEYWLLLHIPQREIIEEDLKGKKRKIRNKAIAREVIQIGLTVLSVGYSTYINKKNIKNIKIVEELLEDKKYLKELSQVEKMVEKFLTKLKNKDKEKALKYFDALKDLGVYKSTNSLTQRSLLSKANQDGNGIVLELIEEVKANLEEKIREKIIDYELDRVFALYLSHVSKEKLEIKLGITIVEKSNYEETGLRLLVLKKENKIVIALGIAETKEKKENDLNKYIKNGKWDKEISEAYCRKIKYLYDKYKKENEITLVGFGENGVLCHLFKLFIEDKKLKVVTFNPLFMKDLVNITRKDLGKNVVANTDEEQYKELGIIIKNELKENIKNVVTTVVTVAFFSMVTGGVPLLIIPAIINIFGGSLSTIGIRCYSEWKNSLEATRLLEILELNKLIEDKKLENKDTLLGYLSEEILSNSFKSETLKLGGRKEVKIKAGTSTKDIFYLLHEILYYVKILGDIDVVFEETEEGYNIIIKNPENIGTHLIIETIFFKKTGELYNIEKIINEKELPVVTIEANELNIEQNELFEILKTLKKIQEAYIEICKGNEIENYYLGNYVENEKEKEEKKKEKYPPEWIQEGLGKNVMLGVREIEQNINENLFFPFVAVNGDWHESKILRVEYIVSVLRSHLENVLSFSNVYVKNKFTKLEKEKEVVKNNKGKELSSKNNTEEIILDFIIEEIKPLLEKKGTYSAFTYRFFLPENISVGINESHKKKLLEYIKKINKDKYSTTVGIGVNANEYCPETLNYGYLTDRRGEEDSIKRGVYQFIQKSTIPKEDGKGADKGIRVVASGATLSCSNGEGIVKLKPTQKHVSEDGKKMATIDDGIAITNIPKFSKCNANSPSYECKIATKGKWVKGGQVPINGRPVLCENGQIACIAMGGIITIKDPNAKGKISE